MKMLNKLMLGMRDKVRCREKQTMCRKYFNAFGCVPLSANIYCCNFLFLFPQIFVGCLFFVRRFYILFSKNVKTPVVSEMGWFWWLRGNDHFKRIQEVHWENPLRKVGEIEDDCLDLSLCWSIIIITICLNNF